MQLECADKRQFASESDNHSNNKRRIMEADSSQLSYSPRNHSWSGRDTHLVERNKEIYIGHQKFYQKISVGHKEKFHQDISLGHQENSSEG